MSDVLPPVKHDICYACDKPIQERDAPPTSGIFQKVGKYTIRRQAWDENWKEITEDTFFHEECYYRGFCFAIKHGWLYGEMMKAVGEVESFRAKDGVDHS